MYVDSQNQSKIPLDSRFLKGLESVFLEILQSLNSQQSRCELLLVDNAKIQAINAEFRNIDAPTDVLSFPLETDFSPILGSVVISVEYAQAVAQKLGHSLEEEITLLFIHGVLHLLGFDHESDGGEHRQIEAEIARHLQLPSSLIVRAEQC